MARRRGDADEATAVRFALVNAVVIATYTLNDAVGVRTAQAPLAYTLWLYPLSAAPTMLWLGRKTPLRWPSMREAARGDAGAGASIGAYALVLWAITQGGGGTDPQAAVGPIAALPKANPDRRGAAATAAG
jgi:hypothetical protein